MSEIPSQIFLLYDELLAKTTVPDFEAFAYPVRQFHKKSGKAHPPVHIGHVPVDGTQ